MTVAVLCRRRAQFSRLQSVFEARGIPYEIVGLGGLLGTPEIVDLVATLRVIADPGRSDALMRLLTGARWRIGPADLMAFADWARYLATAPAVGCASTGWTLTLPRVPRALPGRDLSARHLTAAAEHRCDGRSGGCLLAD